MENYYDHALGDWVTAGSRYDAIANQPRFLDLEHLRDPTASWELLLDLIADLPDDLLPYAGAGPLECLLHLHGAELIPWIEAEAGGNHRFRQALINVNVSRGRFSAELESRLVAAVGAGPGWLIDPTE